MQDDFRITDHWVAEGKPGIGKPFKGARPGDHRAGAGEEEHEEEQLEPAQPGTDDDFPERVNGQGRECAPQYLRGNRQADGKGVGAFHHL